MEQDRSCESDSCSADKEISLYLQNSQNDRGHKNSVLYPVLTQLILIHIRPLRSFLI